MRETPLPRLDHENLDAYRCAIDFLRLALRVASALLRGERRTMRPSGGIT